MFLSLLKLLCQIVAAVNVVQASHSSPEPKDRTSLKSQFIRSRGLNTTLLAGSNGTVTDFTSTSNGSRVPTDLIQHVTLGLPKDPLVQDCANNEGTSVVFQDCSCSTKQVAAQAIDDAITMVHAVQGVWSHPANSPILEYFMGGDAYQSQSCKYPYAVHWIDTILAHLANLSEYRWLPVDSTWLSDYSSNISAQYAYCGTGVPASQSKFTAECLQDNSFGWVYPSPSSNTRPYGWDFPFFFGFCTDLLKAHDFTTRAAMLESWKLSQGQMSIEVLGQNYGRAALNLLVQQALLAISNIPTSQMWYKYNDVLIIAESYGCIPPDYGSSDSSLTNAGNFAWWISTLYYNIEGPTVLGSNSASTPTSTPTPSPTFSPVPISSSNCDGNSVVGCNLLISSSDCDEAVTRYDNDTFYSAYTSHWANNSPDMGCTAIFECSGTYPTGGILGSDVKNYFNQIYLDTDVDLGLGDGAGCSRCGTVFVNGPENDAYQCHFSYNECDSWKCETCLNSTDCGHPNAPSEST